MDRRLSLLAGFSRCFVPGVVKIETEGHGFDFLEALLAGGGRLEYGELTPTRLLHKYKLSGISASRLEALLRSHLDGSLNVCRYFGSQENDVCCFNLDNNRKENNTEIIPEMSAAVASLEEALREQGCDPLIVASGRGYHLWCRLEAPAANERLYDFMRAAALRALRSFYGTALDPRRVKFNFYPDPRTHDVVSLRLFGSIHAKNRVFSRVLVGGCLLDEPASWEAFEAFMAHSPMTMRRFEEGRRSLTGQR